MMTNIDKAYIAGIIDGEGSIMLTRKNKNRYPSPYIAVTSTDFELLEYINSCYRGSICKNKKYQEHHSQSWEWKVSNRVALKLIEDILPYLRIERKIKRAKLLLNDYVACTPRNGKYTQEMLEAKNALIKKFATL